MKYLTDRGAVMTIAVTLALLSGCRSYNISTAIERNGACERVIVIESESGDITDTGYPVPDSTSWAMEVAPNEETDETDDLIYTFRKRFRTVRTLEREMAEAVYPGRRAVPHVKLVKRHRWFTTRLNFLERFDAITDYRSIPISDWFTPDEIDLLVADEADSTLEAREEEWQLRNIFNALIDCLREGAVSLHSEELTPQIIESGRERYYDSLFPAIEEVDDEEIADFILARAGEVYASEQVARLRPQVETFVADIEAYFEFLGRLSEESWEHSVTMPGFITDSNADNEELNQVSWEHAPGSLQYAAIEMWVESQVPNRLAIWITIVVAVGLVALAVWVFVRRS